MKRTTPIITIIALVLLLAACQDPLPNATYEGTTTIEGEDHPLTLTVQQHGERLTGDYYVLNAHGAFNGAVDGTIVTAELQPGADCTYDFEGNLTDTSLTGSFQPSKCAGGQSGFWTLELQ